MNRALLMGLCLGVVLFAAALSTGRREAVATNGPVNLGRTYFNVADFNADPTGATSSLPAVVQALKDCTGAFSVLGNPAGCELHFPQGIYNLDPVSGYPLPILLPVDVPITISGDGPSASILEMTGTGSDFFQGGGISNANDNADGFTLHDVGFNNLSGGSACSAICADVDLPHAHKIAVYNVAFNGPSTAIELGYANGMDQRTGETNISAVTSRNTHGCFLQLNGANGTTHVTGVTADGGHEVSSQVLCMPTANAPNSTTQLGAGTFRLSDSSFTAFGRGISITAYSLAFKNNYVDNVVIDSAEAGPALELFAAPPSSSGAFPPAVIQDFRISNSRLVSAATACLVHGQIQGIKFVNDVCVGGQPAAVPIGCGASSSQRGYVLVELSGTSNSMTTITLTVGSLTPISFSPGADVAPEVVASQLGSLINASSAVTGSCPALVPVQVFEDDLITTRFTHYSIGVDLELISFEWGSTAPTFSASSTGGTNIALVGISATPMPADGMYSGLPPTISGLLPPSDITGDQTVGFGASNGAGLHLQGAASTMFTRSKFGNAASPNQYGVEVETAGTTYSDTQIQGSDLTGNSLAAISFSPPLAIYSGITLSTDLGYNPVAGETSPTMMCAHSVTNPFPVAQQVYIQGAFSSVRKNGTQILGSGSSSIVQLGVGESLRIDCSMAMFPQVRWFGE
jgi:hypothetical protein